MRGCDLQWIQIVYTILTQIYVNDRVWHSQVWMSKPVFLSVSNLPLNSSVVDY